jgi:pimeloyl-ACP methyl ester carboxylesterase
MNVSSSQTSYFSPRKSTIDHAISIPIPAPIRLGYKLASRISPELGAELARRIFFHPPRLRFSKAQETALAHADRHEFGGSSGRIVTYSWGSGPVVLLVHGWGGHSGQMAAFAAPLVADGFRAVAVDLPAHGRSAGSLSSLVHFAEALHIVAYAFAPVHGVITHSLGGAGLVRALLSGFSPKRAVLISPQAQLSGYWRAFQRSLGMSDAGWAAMMANAERWLAVRFADLHPRIAAPKMTVPALILHGQTDRMSPVSEGREMAKLWPGARISEFTDTGHLAILRDPVAIRAARDFMAGQNCGVLRSQ